MQDEISQYFIVSIFWPLPQNRLLIDFFFGYCQIVTEILKISGKKKVFSLLNSVYSLSLPRFVVVPQKVLDTELKKSFAHFNDGRIPVSDVPLKNEMRFSTVSE